MHKSLKLVENFQGFLKGKLWEVKSFRKFCEFECLGSLESLKTCEIREMISSDALFKGRNWVGVISLKTQGEIPAIGLVPHCWIGGTTLCLEQLMMPHRLQSASSNHGTHKWHFYVCRSRDKIILMLEKSKPYFSPWTRGKN